MNEALRDAGLTARVDHRGFKARGINREPVPEHAARNGLGRRERDKQYGARRKLDHTRDHDLSL